MKKLMALMVSLASGALLATSVRPVSLESMAARAALVAEGRALSSWSQWNSEHTMILTYTRFQVSRALKGAAAGEVIIRQPGGTAGVYRDLVHGVRYLKPGEEAALFLQESSERDGTMVVVGLVQGMFRMERSESGETFVSNGVSGLEAQSEGGSVRAFRGTRIPLSEFEARVTKAAK